MKTNKNIKCLGKCEKHFLHPITLIGHSAKSNKLLCPTNVFIDDKNLIGDYIECKDEIYDTTLYDEDMYLKPTIGINYDTFLHFIYDIKSLDDVIKWFNENYDAPYNTIDRILNVMWYVFLTKILYNPTVIFNFYFNVFEKLWLNNLKVYFKSKYPSDLVNKIVNDNVKKSIDKAVSEKIKHFNYIKKIDEIERTNNSIKINIYKYFEDKFNDNSLDNDKLSSNNELSSNDEFSIVI